MDTNHVKVFDIPMFTNPDYFFQPVFPNPEKHTKLLADDTPYNPTFKKLENMVATHICNHITIYRNTKSH